MKKINKRKREKNKMTNKKTIEGIRFIARDTQKMKVFDKVAYASWGSSAVLDLLNDAHDYQSKYEHEFSIYEAACIDFGKIDTEVLRDRAVKMAEQNDEDENDLYCEYLDEAIEKVNPPHSKIMEYIFDEIGYYHEVQLYNSEEWFDDSEIDLIDYDDGEKGTFTLKEDEE